MSAASSTTDVHSQDHIPLGDNNLEESSPDEDALVEEPKTYQNLKYRNGTRQETYMEISSDTSDTDVASSSEDGYSSPDSNDAGDFRLTRLDKNNNNGRSLVGALDVTPVVNLATNAGKDIVTNSLEAPSTSMSQVDLFEDVGRVMALLKTRGHSADVDLNVVYEKLENVQHSNDRVTVVADEIVRTDTPDVIIVNVETGGTNNKLARPTTALQEIPVHMAADVELIQAVCPDASLAEVLRLLDMYDSHPNRIDLVTDFLLTNPSVNNVAAVNHNQLVNTAPQLVINIPDVSGPDIIGTVTNVPLVATDQIPDDVQTETERNSVVVLPAATATVTSMDPQPSTSATNDLELKAPESENKDGDHWSLLRELLPDADPDYLLAVVDQCQGNIEELMKQVNTCMELRNYPKLTEAIQRQEQHALKRKYLERNFTVEEFLELYDDPVSYFYNTNRPVSEQYKELVLIQLSNDFGLVYKTELTNLIRKHNYHLTPAYRELQQIYGGNNEPGGKRRKCVNQRCKKQATPYQPLPDTFDEMFYKEIVFLELEESIRDYKNVNTIARNLKLESAKLNNEICTCGCCYDDELLLEEMLTCSEGHMFCKECIRRSSEENIGQGKLKFPCLSGDCTADIPLQTLQEALKPAVFSNLVRRLQEEEIRLAAIDDLVSCPFCSFSAIMSNPEDKVFKCLNPDCLKESCRLCREPSHIPLRCEEVEKSQEVKMRTYIEDKMTESLLRTCPRCKRRFIKLDGCNKMTCQCGQIMCYVCRQPIKDYSHFGTGKGSYNVLAPSQRNMKKHLNSMHQACAKEVEALTEKEALEHIGARQQADLKRNYSKTNPFTWDHPRCPQFSDDHQLHVLEVQRGAEKAKQELLQEHPELGQLQLKHDPTKDLTTGTQLVPGARPLGGQIPVMENGRIVFHQNQQRANFPHHAHAPWMPVPPQFVQMYPAPADGQFPHPRQRPPPLPGPPPPFPPPPPPVPPPLQNPAAQPRRGNRYVTATLAQAAERINNMLQAYLPHNPQVAAIAAPNAFTVLPSVQPVTTVPTTRSAGGAPTINVCKLAHTAAVLHPSQEQGAGNNMSPSVLASNLVKVFDLQLSNVKVSTVGKRGVSCTTSTTGNHTVGLCDNLAARATATPTRSAMSAPRPDQQKQLNVSAHVAPADNANSADMGRRKRLNAYRASAVKGINKPPRYVKLLTDKESATVGSVVAAPSALTFTDAGGLSKVDPIALPSNYRNNTEATHATNLTGNLISVPKLVIANSSKPMSSIVPSSVSIAPRIRARTGAAPTATTNSIPGTIMSIQKPSSSGVCSLPGLPTNSNNTVFTSGSHPTGTIVCSSKFRPNVTSYLQNSNSLLLKNGAQLPSSSAINPNVIQGTLPVRLSVPAATNPRLISATSAATSILRPAILTSTAATSASNAMVRISDTTAPVPASTVFVSPMIAGQLQLPNNRSTVVAPNIPDSLVGQTVRDNPGGLFPNFVQIGTLNDCPTTGAKPLSASSNNRVVSQHIRNTVAAPVGTTAVVTAGITAMIWQNPPTPTAPSAHRSPNE